MIFVERLTCKIRYLYSFQSYITLYPIYTPPYNPYITISASLNTANKSLSIKKVKRLKGIMLKIKNVPQTCTKLL